MYSILDIFTSLLSLSNSIFLNERYKIEFQINQTLKNRRFFQLRSTNEIEIGLLIANYRKEEI